MKKVFFAAVLGVIVLGNSYAASAIKELKLEAPSSTLENAGILPVAAAAKVKKSADADKNQGTLFIIERFPANYGLVNVIVERDMRRESGALLAEYKATDYGYELTTKFPGGKAGTLTMIEMFPKKNVYPRGCVGGSPGKESAWV